MNIEISMATLATDIRKAEDLLATIKKDMEKMFASVEELDTLWDGPASEKFKEEFLKDKNLFDNVCGNANNLIEHLTTSNAIYNKCEESVASKISKIVI